MHDQGIAIELNDRLEERWNETHLRFVSSTGLHADRGLHGLSVGPALIRH